MNEKFEIGDFGHAHFPSGKFKGIAFDLFGIVKTIEPKYILFEDNDNFLYIVRRKDFQFEKMEFKNKAV